MIKRHGRENVVVFVALQTLYTSKGKSISPLTRHYFIGIKNFEMRKPSVPANPVTPGLSGQCASLGFDQCGGVRKPKGGVGGLKYLKGKRFWGGKKTQDNTFNKDVS